MQPGLRIGPLGANHGSFTAKPSSHHVHSTLPVTPPTSPCPTLSADAETAHKRAETLFSAQCAVLCNQKCTIEFNLRLKILQETVDIHEQIVRTILRIQAVAKFHSQGKNTVSDRDVVCAHKG